MREKSEVQCDFGEEYFYLLIAWPGYSGDEIKKNEIGWECSTWGRKARYNAILVRNTSTCY